MSGVLKHRPGTRLAGSSGKDAKQGSRGSTDKAHLPDIWKTLPWRNGRQRAGAAGPDETTGQERRRVLRPAGYLHADQDVVLPAAMGPWQAATGLLSSPARCPRPSPITGRSRWSGPPGPCRPCRSPGLWSRRRNRSGQWCRLDCQAARHPPRWPAEPRRQRVNGFQSNRDAARVDVGWTSRRAREPLDQGWRRDGT